MLDRISFVVGEALIALRRNAFMTFSAITTVAIAMYLLGGLGFLYISLAKGTQSLGTKFEIYVYLKPSVTPKNIQETAQAIREIDGVGTVSWIPRDKAWALWKAQEPDLTEGIDENPLNDSYKVTLSNLDRSETVVESIRNLPAVLPDHVEYLQKEQRMMNQILRFIGWLSSAGVLLMLIAGILIYNTIRQAMLARSLEIRIMRLVGASRATIGVPFLLEGLIHGAVGGAIAALFVRITDAAVAQQLNASLQVKIPEFPTLQFTALCAGIGATYGVVCSLLALRYRHQ